MKKPQKVKKIINLCFYISSCYLLGCVAKKKNGNEIAPFPVVRFPTTDSIPFFSLLSKNVEYHIQQVDTVSKIVELNEEVHYLGVYHHAQSSLLQSFGRVTQGLSIEIQDMLLGTQTNTIKLLRWDFQDAQASRRFYDVYRMTYNAEKSFMIEEVFLLDYSVYFFKLKASNSDKMPYMRLGRLHELSDRIRYWLFLNCTLELNGKSIQPE